ncbi:MAG: hypothetical protein ABFQ65_04500 [Nanoarchaeota archaeon]
MKILTDLDYVEIYSEKLKNNFFIFEQQKKLINSQIQGSLSIMRNMFGKYNFKLEARKYLREVGILK